MKQMMPKQICFAAAGFGAAGFFLRLTLYEKMTDGRGLLPRRHPLALAGIALAGLLLLLLLSAAGKKAPAAPLTGRLPALGSLVMAGGILLSLSGSLLLRAAGMAAAACLLASALLRRQEKPVPFLLHGLVCVFFAAYLISRYRGWSCNPQIQDHLYTMGAGILLMLYAYQQAAGDLKTGSRRAQLVLGGMAAFFCLTALGDNPWLHLGGAVWTLTGLWSADTEGTDCR